MALAPGDSTKTVMVGTLNRSYLLHIPRGYTGTKPVPLVIDFHPLGGTGSSQANANGWKAKADSVGFITAYPNSYNSNNSWNVGFCCQDAQKNQIDDVGFTRAMIQQIATIACLDTKRVYATGCSNGGGMTYKVACDLADMIAGAAPVDFRCVYGGTATSPSCEGCKPARAISITHFDNTGDNSLVPYNGGTTSFPANCPPNQSCVGMAFPSAQANFSAWQKIDGCTGSTSALSGHAACMTNMSCQDDAQVTMCVQQGGGHCGNYTSLGIVDIAWEMFQKQALP
jgi:polyhydroxybutyrate depolymerase